MKIKPWLLALGLGAGFGMMSVGSMAQLPDRPVKVGVLTDMSGTYSAMGARGRWSPRKWRSTIVWPPNARA